MSSRALRPLAVSILLLSGGVAGGCHDGPADVESNSLPLVAESPLGRELLRKHESRFQVRSQLVGPAAPPRDPAAVPPVEPSPVLTASPARFRKLESGYQAEFSAREGAGATSSARKSIAASVPERADQAFNLVHSPSSMELRVKVDGAGPVSGLVADGYVIFPGATASRSDLLFRVSPDAVEEFQIFEMAPTLPRARYHVELSSGVAGIRLVSNVLEFLDRKGVPRLRVARPYLVDSDGRWIWAELAVHGCAVDTNSSPPWRRAVTAPGAGTCQVEVSWHNSSLRYPAILDPQWTDTTAMTNPRESHAAVELAPGGEVFVTGGWYSKYYGISNQGTSEFYDPELGVWTIGPAMAADRKNHVMVAAFFQGSWKAFVDGDGSFEIYDGTGFTGLTQRPSSQRSRHAAALLNDGRIFVVGGPGGTEAETYNPSNGTWSSFPRLSERWQARATLRADGRVLVTGGTSSSGQSLATAELWNSATGAWSAAPSMQASRSQHAAALLKNGDVLVVGGQGLGSTAQTAEILKPGASSWAIVAAPLFPRYQPTATVTRDNEVVVSGSSLVSEIYVGAAWKTAGTAANEVARIYHTSTPLGAQVLIAGGSEPPPPPGSAAKPNRYAWRTAVTYGGSFPVPSCQGIPVGVLCEDNSACTQDTVCDGAGNCGNGTAVTCNDNRICTADSCDPTRGCVHTPLADGSGCGSGTTCQINVCSGGACILQPRPSPPPSCSTPPVTASVKIPQGVTGTLEFKYEASNTPAGITNAFGLIKRNPSGDATYVELLDSSERSAGEIFHRITVQGGEEIEFYLQANKLSVTSPSMTPATYSSDYTRNSGVDPTAPEHVQLPTQTPQQVLDKEWSLRWEASKSGDPTRDGNFDDLKVLLKVRTPCGGSGPACQDPAVAASSHDPPAVDFRAEPPIVGVPLPPGVPAGPLTDPSAGEGNPVPLGMIRNIGGDRVDVARLSFVHEALDYSPGGSGTAIDGGLSTGGRRRLEVKRIHRPRATTWVSSFGHGVFSNFDAKLRIRPNNVSNQREIQFFDPELDASPITFYEVSAQDGDLSNDGRYHDPASRSFESLVLLTNSGALQPDPNLAVYAVLTSHSGGKLRFEVIDSLPTNTNELQARLTAIEDRNGNSISITYQFPASATDEALGNDRTKLWHIHQVSDPTGLTAGFTYGYLGTPSKWVVATLMAPGNKTTTYNYYPAGELFQVAHPGGATSNFARQWDSSLQAWELTIREAGLGPAKLPKKVYLTGNTYTISSRFGPRALLKQEPNLVRRITGLGNEKMFEAMEDPNNGNTIYIREGDDRLTRVRMDDRGAPIDISVATNGGADPLVATYETRERYKTSAQGGLTQVTDPNGKIRELTADSSTRVITKVKGRDGVQATIERNKFRQPTRTTDRSGRVIEVTYDGKGNATKIKYAPGTLVEATWQYDYNDQGQITRVTDPNSHSTDYSYDGSGRLVALTDAADVVGGPRPLSRFEYDSSGRISATTDPAGRRTTFAYTDAGRLKEVLYPDGKKETRTYKTGLQGALLESKTSPREIVERYEYDSSERLRKVIQAYGRPEQGEVAFEYLSGTELVSKQVTDGETVEIGYDERNRPISRKVHVTDTRSLTSTTAYDAFDRPSEQTDPYGRATHFVYDDLGRVTRTVQELLPGGVPTGADLRTLPRITGTNPNYVIRETGYNNMSQVLSQKDELGTETMHFYDEQGRRNDTWEAWGTSLARRTYFAYDPVGNLTIQAHPRGFVEGVTFNTVHTYTGRNLLASTTEAAGTGDTATTSFTYTLTGKLLQKRDPRAAVTTQAYDACCDRVASITDAAGFRTSYGYDDDGNRTSVTNHLNKKTSVTYDGRNRVLTERDALGNTTSYAYDDNLSDLVGLSGIYSAQLAALGFGANADGSGVRRTNAAGESEVTFRDGAGRVVLRVDAGGGVTTTNYDFITGGGTVVTVVWDPLGHGSWDYQDGAGRSRYSADAEGNLTERYFSPTGNLEMEKDPNNLSTTCGFDVLNRRTSCTDAKNNTTVWTPDAADNITVIKDGLGNETRCAFDRRNRKQNCTDRVNGTTQWYYDANSNLTDVIDAEERPTGYTYDSRNLRTSITYPDSTGGSDKVVFTYDEVGRLSAQIDQSGNLKRFEYDDAGRLIARHYSDETSDRFGLDAVGRIGVAISGRYGVTVNRDYNPAGRLERERIGALGVIKEVRYEEYDLDGRAKKIRYPDGKVVTRTYTARHQLKSTTLEATPIVSEYQYDPGGRLQTTMLGNGLTETRQYWDDNTVQSISTPGAVGDLTYTYDANRRKKTEGGTAISNAQTFDYDNEGRLTSWTGVGGNQSWTLSKVGDWDNTTRNGYPADRNHNAVHELLDEDNVPMTYDARGNLLGVWTNSTFDWDLDNRVTKYVQSFVGTVHFLYDAFGRPVVRQNKSVTPTVSEFLVYDGQDLIFEESDAGATGGGFATRRYIQGPK